MPRRRSIKKKPPPYSVRVLGIKPLAVTYSCMEVHTTIGAAAFHFRVRDGIGWGHSAIAAREGVEAALLERQASKGVNE
jgi:hypothetical protein